MVIQEKVEIDKKGIIDCPVCDGKGSRMFRGKFKILCTLCRGAKKVIKAQLPLEDELESKRKSFMGEEFV